MEYKVCRTCLSGSGLNPIFPDSENHKRYSTAIYITTGIKITPNDGLPQNMCTDCIAFLNKSLQFRMKCRSAEEYLLKSKNNLDLLTLRDNDNRDYKAIKDDTVDSAQENGDLSALKGTECIKLHTLDIIHIELLSQDKTICEAKYEDVDVTEATKNIVNIEIKREYLDDPSIDYDDDDDRPLNDSRDGNKELNAATSPVSIVLEEGSIKETNIKNEDSEIIIPKAPSRRITCQYCSKNLSIRSLNEHIAQQHPGADDRRVKCALCDKYVVKAKMSRHRKIRHDIGNTFMCAFCKTDYESEQLLIDHVSACTSNKKHRRRAESTRKLAECHVCHKKMLKASLKPHVAVKHEGKGPVCEPKMSTAGQSKRISTTTGPALPEAHCGRRFGNKLRLSEHRRARHGHDKFKCARCDYQSASEHTMKNHERRHRGERPFVCEACGSGFHSLHLLHQHRQSHRTEKLIKCDLCPATFKANNSLHVHKMTCHSGSPYRCGLCARTFSCKNYAARHVKHVHGLAQPASVLERINSEIESEQ